MDDFAYLDWNATTPLGEGVLAAMVAASQRAGANPSSVHRAGRLARRILEDLREKIAQVMEAAPQDVLFTGSGTEANNIAIRSPFVEARGVLITSRLEHPSVTRVAEALEREGRAQVHWAPVSAAGLIDVGNVREVLRRGGVRLVTLQAVNQETGVVQPVQEVHAECMQAGVPIHVDAVQAFGRMEVPLLGTTRTLAAHKFQGPKGIGALVSSCGHRLHPVLLGGAQEKGLRPGTLDPMAAAGFLAALQDGHRCREGFASQRASRDRLEAHVLSVFPGSEVNGDPALRLAHVSNVAVAGLDGAELVVALDVEGVAVSSGSACSAGTLEPSPVIAAMHSVARAKSSIRMSLGPGTTDRIVDGALQAISRIAGRPRR